MENPLKIVRWDVAPSGSAPVRSSSVRFGSLLSSAAMIWDGSLRAARMKDEVVN